MSLYRKAWLFTGWTAIVFLTSSWWLFGPAERWGAAAAISGVLFWLAHGAAAKWCFGCPACGCSAFARWRGPPALYAPWPRRRCACCGHDHSGA